MDFNPVSKAFGLNEDTWMNHANLWSGYFVDFHQPSGVPQTDEEYKSWEY